MVEMPPLRLAMLSVSHKSSFSSPITLSFLLGCDNRLHVSRNCPQHVTRYIFLIFGQRCASSIVWKCGIHFPIYKKSVPEKCIFNLGCSPFQSFTNLLFSIFATMFAKIRQNHHKHHRRPLHIIFEKETKWLVPQAFTFTVASCFSECTTPLLSTNTKKDKIIISTSRFPCCVLLALSWNTTNENPSTDKLSRAIN